MHLAGSAGQVLVCERCGHQVPLREGIAMMAADRDFYYEEIPLPAMERFLEHARNHDFATLFEKPDRDAPWSFILGSHFDCTRAGWMYTTRLEAGGEKRRALDFGSGWGINAVALAPYFREVVALELSYHRLLNLQLLSRMWGLDNVTTICGGDAPRLPFPNSYFDLVVLNGVIEWIPVGRRGNGGRGRLSAGRPPSSGDEPRPGRALRGLSCRAPGRAGWDVPHPLLRTLTVRLLEHAELSSSDLKYLVVIYLYHTLSKYWQGSTSYGFRTRFLGPIGHIVLEGAYELANEIL